MNNRVKMAGFKRGGLGYPLPFLPGRGSFLVGFPFLGLSYFAVGDVFYVLVVGFFRPLYFFFRSTGALANLSQLVPQLVHGLSRLAALAFGPAAVFSRPGLLSSNTGIFPPHESLFSFLGMAFSPFLSVLPAGSDDFLHRQCPTATTPPLPLVPRPPLALLDALSLCASSSLGSSLFFSFLHLKVRNLSAVPFYHDFFWCRVPA